MAERYAYTVLAVVAAVATVLFTMALHALTVSPL